MKEAFRNDHLVAEGFIPVSPALTAKAKEQLNNGDIDQQKHDLLIKNSGMPELHEQLEKYLVNTSAPQHLRDIIFKMQAVQKALRRHISSQIESAESPIQQAEEDIKRAQDLSRSLQKSKDSIDGRLLSLINQQLSQVFSAIDPDDLTKELTDKLEKRINKQDLTKAKVRHKLEQDVREIRDAWLSKEGIALDDRWQKAWIYYLQQAQLIVEEELTKAYQQSLKPGSGGLGDGKDISLPTRDIIIPVDAIAGVVGLAGGVLTGGGIVVGAVAIAVWPLAALFVATGLISYVVGLVKTGQANKVLRQETLQQLGVYSKELLDGLRQQGHEAYMKYHSEVMNVIGDMIAVQQDKIKSTQKRLDDEGELAQNKQRISDLNHILTRINKTDEQFQQFFVALSNVSLSPPHEY